MFKKKKKVVFYMLEIRRISTVLKKKSRQSFITISIAIFGQNVFIFFLWKITRVRSKPRHVYSLEKVLRFFFFFFLQS